MILTKTSMYALRILISMASGEKVLASAQGLHDTLGIKLQYLRRILTDLSKAGFIRSSRGRNGGYVFARKPEKIFLFEVIDAIEGFDSFDACILGLTDCNRAEKCTMHKIWDEAKQNMLTTFRTTCLADLSSVDLNSGLDLLPNRTNTKT